MNICQLDKSQKIKILLDENIYPKLSEHFSKTLFDITSIIKDYDRGIPDDKVLEIANNEHRLLLTKNGKDFIIQIPPKGKTSHYGLLWVFKNLNVSAKNASVFANVINQFILGYINLCKEEPYICKDFCKRCEGNIYLLKKCIPDAIKIEKKQ